MSKIRILNKADILSVFTMKMALEAVEGAYSEKASGNGSVWPMVFHEFQPGAADLDIKSGDLGKAGIFGLKVVSWFGQNPPKGLPALYGTSLVFDLATGAPKALLDAGPITAFRTGAAAALGMKYLARASARSLLMVGCGGVSAYLIAAALLVRPELETVLVVTPHKPSRAEERLPALIDRVDAILKGSGAERTAEILCSADVESAVWRSDIVFTATPSYKPLIDAAWVKAGTHFSCIGSDMSGKQEISSEIFRNAKVYVDDKQQCLSVGECEIPYKAGVIQEISGEIGELINGTKSGRSSEQDVTIFDSTGIALQDLASAAVILRKAEQNGIGVEVEL